MRWSVIIFDLDGTLVNAYPAVARSVNFTLKKLGFPQQADFTIKRAVGWGDRNLLLRFVGQDQIEEALTIYRKHHAQALLKGTTFLPGAKILLDRLRKLGYQLAIASNRPSKYTKIILKHLKIDGHFKSVLCADQIKAGKPDPLILREITKRLQCSPAEVLYVGDMTIDVETGNRAGIRTVAVLTGSSTKDEIALLSPYRVISSLSSLKGILSESGKESFRDQKSADFLKAKNPLLP